MQSFPRSFVLLLLTALAITATAQQTTPPAAPTPPATPAPAPTGPRVTLDDVIKLALAHSPAIRATRTQIEQSQAQEVTAHFRPNPVLGWDTQFIPIFNPSQFTSDTLNQLQQFDIGIGYLWERGGKRNARFHAAQDQTSVVRAQVGDAERTLTFNVAQQFIAALLAQSSLEFAQTDLKSFQDTVRISEERYRAGDISEADLLKIKLQTLQFQTDVSSARVAYVQALGSLRQLVGYDALPADVQLAGDLEYAPLTSNLDDLQAAALRQRPDLMAAQKNVTAAQSQVTLARADAKQDLDTTLNYSHVSGSSSTSLFFSIPLPIFNRNQGEIARTRSALTQAQLTNDAASQLVMTDVRNGYEAARSNEEVVKLYLSGYLKQSQDSRDISEYAYRKGAASLLDLLDAERSYRSTQLAYRQALANYMISLEQLRQAIGSRNLP